MTDIYTFNTVEPLTEVLAKYNNSPKRKSDMSELQTAIWQLEELENMQKACDKARNERFK